MRSRGRLLLALLLGVATLPPVSSAQQDPVAALLARHAEAVARGDRAAFEETMAGAPASFAQRKRAWFDRIRKLPIASYALEVTDEEFGDLSREKDRRGYDEVRLVQADEKIALRGYDDAAAGEDVFLTVARSGTRWSIVGDDGVEDLGLLSMRNLWDFGEIAIEQDDGIMVVFHPSERSAVATIVAQAKRARARVRRGWPFEWNDPIVIMVPSTVTELERILQTTFDLTQFVAFAASSVERDQGYRLAGNRIFLHWPNFRRYSGSFQETVLAHEFLHLATRDMAGPYVTAIFDEGVAQHYGEGGGETEQIRRRIRNRTLPTTLVPDWFFLAGPRDDIFLAYEEAASFVRYLDRRFGAGSAARAYRALGEIDPVTPGTWRYHLDRVFDALLKQSYAALERGWYESVRREYS